MSWIKNIILLVVSLSVSLFIAEKIVRVFYPQNLSGSWAVIDDYGLMMNKSEGYSFHTLGDRRADYAFEKFGVRSSFVTNNNATRKVLILGDSFTFGWLLNDDSTYTKLLAEANTHMAFLNAATAGWGASDYTAYMETYCKQINPDITLVVMNADDIGRMLRSKLYKYDPNLQLITRSKYEATSWHRLKALLNSFPLYSFLMENVHLVQLARATYLGSNVSNREKTENPKPKVSNFGMRDVENIDYSNQFSAALFQYLSKISIECGSGLRVVYSGVQKQNKLGIYPTLEFIKYAKEISFFENLGIKFVDLTDTPYLTEYRNNLSTYIIGHDDHPNEAGAKLLFNAINQSGILLNDS